VKNLERLSKEQNSNQATDQSGTVEPFSIDVTRRGC